MLAYTGSITFTGSTTLSRYLRVKFDGSNELAVAGAADLEFGTLTDAVLTADDPAAIVPRRIGDVPWMVADGVVTQYATVYGAASGKVSATANANSLGIALDAAGADGDEIRVLRQQATSLYLGNDVVIITKAGAPVDGTSGTGVGYAGPGSLLIDYTNGLLYQNTGTKTSPAWDCVGLQTT